MSSLVLFHFPGGTLYGELKGCLLKSSVFEIYMNRGGIQDHEQK